MTKVPVHPKNPERVCWGCDKYCSADALRCGNGTIRTPHPIELFGEDWTDWGVDVPETNKSSLVDNASEKHLSQLHDLNGHHTSMTEASEPGDENGARQMSH